MAAPIRLYNTLNRHVEDFEPIEDGKIRLYVCGMTVYDHCHVGHARAMVVFDTFVRYLRHRGWQVRFVRNFTDVDDKIIERANKSGEKPLELAQRYIDSFYKDAKGLNLLMPDAEPRVSTSIDAIVGLIGDLVERGHAYATDGNVWFSVETDEAYGKLSNQKVDELRNPDEFEGKRAPADFALWKAVKPGEPSWESPWGPGRPGWHIECSAMAKKELGDTIDIHGGGLDLVFPHHENEVAQSECGNGVPYARYWMHNGMLTEFPAEAIRLYYLQNQYRSPLPWGDEALPDALAMLSRLYDAREKAEAMSGKADADSVAEQLGKDAKKVLELGRSFQERFFAAVDHDFNTALGLGHLFELARAVNRFAAHKKAKSRGGPVVQPAIDAFALMRDALGLMCMDTDAFHDEVKSKRLAALGIEVADIDKLLVERAAAREAKDWARADAIRDELTAKRIVVLDLADRVEWRVKLSAD